MSAVIELNWVFTKLLLKAMLGRTRWYGSGIVIAGLARSAMKSICTIPNRKPGKELVPQPPNPIILTLNVY